MKKNLFTFFLISVMICSWCGCIRFPPKPEEPEESQHSEETTYHEQETIVYVPETPPPPTPTDYVLEVINLQIEYQRVFNESMERMGERMKNRQEDFEGVVGAVGDMRVSAENFAQYIQNLQRIDISKCPADFQVRFNTYVNSEIRVLELIAGITHPSTEGEGGLFGNLIGGVLVAGLGGEQIVAERDAAKKAMYDLATQKYDIVFN